MLAREEIGDLGLVIGFLQFGDKRCAIRNRHSLRVRVRHLKDNFEVVVHHGGTL
ncbi:hypothetical protein CR513_03083, partial [Mucuna pruriens]